VKTITLERFEGNFPFTKHSICGPNVKPKQNGGHASEGHLVHLKRDNSVQFVQLLLFVTLKLADFSFGRVQCGIDDALFLDQRFMILLERLNSLLQIRQNIFLVQTLFPQLANLLVPRRSVTKIH
jgi:hypothetical protein